MPAVIPRGDAGFRDDAGRALGVWRQQPMLPVMSIGYGALTALSCSRWSGAWLAGLVAIALTGWVGAQRLWYLRAFTGRELSPRDALCATFTYFGRFFRLGLLLLVVLAPLSIPVVISSTRKAVATLESGGDAQVSLGVLLYFGVLWLLVDLALTFVTPALVYSTESASTAIRIGWQLLRRSWPHTGFYVLFPPLAVLFLTRLSTGPVGWVGGTIVAVSTLLNLLARGATGAYYLRVMTPAGPDGAVKYRPSHHPSYYPAHDER